MDLSTLDIRKASEETYRFEVLHPVTNEKTGAFIDVYSSQSDVVRKFANGLFRKLQKDDLESKRSRRPKLRDLDDIEQESINNAIVRVAGWENVEWEGKALEFNDENVSKVLNKCPWLCSQIVEHSDDLGNFLKSGSKD
ncbi:hypothetical protein [Pasteurella multocida]|uniref:hypothetical protein n=1 Tax=Pasteurella multocida TaxID=747 RepID=UPI002A4E89EC|nr:hypothetical protein [Pasteurella multocida]MDY0577099.1 hypothetical protein [Pasteurella multocida]MEB3501376.1 hypothetical protein [Pasteurella multocida]WRK02037.1 hypothetical protein RFF39_05310 [Pasteurella multocida]HDR1187544.1 hypothetical protein [Pasteurella multocida]HDR1228856.1 hypothetical protein [Pasteurella multocida]